MEKVSDNSNVKIEILKPENNTTQKQEQETGGVTEIKDHIQSILDNPNNKVTIISPEEKIALEKKANEVKILQQKIISIEYIFDSLKDAIARKYFDCKEASQLYELMSFFNDKYAPKINKTKIKEQSLVILFESIRTAIYNKAFDYKQSALIYSHMTQFM
ncbi:hypothetical protein HN415_00835 [Candidatus Woesearchaeota archaeon]|jgi:hypothetical protein|nr:hypothetical protein [Candidatus Woesearchaeota archaeon]